MRITYRLANINDYRQTEELTREAFWNLFKPGCDEHLMVHQLRKSPGYIPELDLIAYCEDDSEKIVGHILYTRSYVINEDGGKHEVIAFGPISVLPEFQKQGIGSGLIERTIILAREKGYKGIFIYGGPGYYNRFGFVNAKKYNVSTPDGSNFEEFMGLELNKDSLKGISGKFYNDLGYEIDKDVLEAFDSTFPVKD